MLRLHKYAPFFSHMSYEEMLELTEDVLEHRNITKGARQKLILSIQKLKARSAVLLTSEQELVDLERKEYRYKVSYSCLSQVLFQVRAFLSTPIRPSPVGDEDRFGESMMTFSGSLSSSVSPVFSPFLTSPVDLNNNHHHQVGTGSYNRWSNHKKFLQCWSSLTNNDLSNIITRLIGHSMSFP